MAAGNNRLAVLRNAELVSSSFSKTDEAATGKGRISLEPGATFIFSQNEGRLENFRLRVSLSGQAFKIIDEKEGNLSEEPVFQFMAEVEGLFEPNQDALTLEAISNEPLTYIDQLYTLVVQNCADLIKRGGIQKVNIPWTLPQEVELGMPAGE